MAGINRENWFLVVPTIVLGLVALYTLHSMYAAGDLRRAIEVVTEYRAESRQPLGEWLASRSASMQWDAEVVSRFYGTMEVVCRLRPTSTATADVADGRADGSAGRGAGSRVPDGEPPPEREYRWRVDTLQRGFAPADEATRDLMREYDPGTFTGAEER